MGGSFKDQVRDFWEEIPCGTRGIDLAPGTSGFFESLERQRDEREPFIDDFARFGAQRERLVLEVGIGTGTDFIRFARGGAHLHGLDLTHKAARLARARLDLEGRRGNVLQGDAESLPYADDSFDYVYSWGVIHHTEDTERAAREIIRVVKPGGEVCVMVYHRYSLVALQRWILSALLSGRPWRSLSSVIASGIESLGTKAYSMREVRDLFSRLREIAVTPVVTPYDVRLTRSWFLPETIRSMVPDRLGWFLVIRGRK